MTPRMEALYRQELEQVKAMPSLPPLRPEHITARDILEPLRFIGRASIIITPEPKNERQE